MVSLRTIIHESAEVTQVALTGTNSTPHVINHGKDRAPDTVQLQYRQDITSGEWIIRKDTDTRASGNWGGFGHLSEAAGSSTISVFRIAGVTYNIRFKLSWLP